MTKPMQQTHFWTKYSKTSFLVQIKFIAEDSEQTDIQILILN